MRRSIPKSEKTTPRRRSAPVKTQNVEKQNGKVPHDPDFDMQYGCSRKTGVKAGGYFWNPPDYCQARIECSDVDRWVRVGFCKKCLRWKTGTCPARKVNCRIYENGYVHDEPKTRKAARQKERTTSRRRS